MKRQCGTSQCLEKVHPFQGKDNVVPPSVLQRSSLYQIIVLDRDDQYLMVPVPLMKRAVSQ